MNTNHPNPEAYNELRPTLLRAQKPGNHQEKMAEFLIKQIDAEYRAPKTLFGKIKRVLYRTFHAKKAKENRQALENALKHPKNWQHYYNQFHQNS